MKESRVAVVTGSNKGIGFAIVEALCKSFNGVVYLTARDETRGMEAVKNLEEKGLKPLFHQLDIEDEKSVHTLAKYLEQKYGGLDLLVNNAAISLMHDSTLSLAEQAERTMRCNYWGTFSVCSILFPSLRSHARVINMSCLAGHTLFNKCSDELKTKLLSLTTIEELSLYMANYVRDVKAETYKAAGWSDHMFCSYGASKIGITLLTSIQQKIMDADADRKDIIINACCPGYVATDLNQHKSHKTTAEGAEIPVYLSLLPENATEPRGKFVSDRKVVPIGMNMDITSVG